MKYAIGFIIGLILAFAWRMNDVPRQVSRIEQLGDSLIKLKQPVIVNCGDSTFND